MTLYEDVPAGLDLKLRWPAFGPEDSSSPERGDHLRSAMLVGGGASRPQPIPSAAPEGHGAVLPASAIEGELVVELAEIRDQIMTLRRRLTVRGRARDLSDATLDEIAERVAARLRADPGGRDADVVALRNGALAARTESSPRRAALES